MDLRLIDSLHWAADGLVRWTKDRVGAETLERHIRQVLDTYRVDCVIDVGAHIGQTGRLFRQIGYRGRIESFEPVAENYATLLKRSRFYSKWQVHPMALGDESTVVDVNVPRTTQFASLLTTSQFSADYYQSHSEVVKTQPVTMRRLDSIPIEGERIYLKIDTQGSDLRVIAGASGIMNRVVAIQTELSVTPIYNGMPDYVQALSSIRDLGFEVSGIYTQDRVKQSLKLVELDCVLVRKSFHDFK
jgi:FkbM family methyltransferase